MPYSLMMPFPIKNLLDPINRFIIRSKHFLLVYSYNALQWWILLKMDRKNFLTPFVSNVFNS